MPPLRLLLVCAVLLPLDAQTNIDVGSGVSDALRQRFVNAFFRNGFSNIVSTPPLGNVTPFGAGLRQEFQDVAKTSGVRLALIKANTSSTITIVQDQEIPDVLQVRAAIYAYYLSLGLTTAGFPSTDTRNCPSAPCAWQLFDRNYALFAFEQPTASGQNFFTRDPFYTRWIALGGIGTLGPATGAEQPVTSSAGTEATTQAFLSGALYNITSGTLSGRFVSVRQPVYALYAANGLHSGFLGLPSGEEIVLATGRRRQSFEGGAIEYDSGSEPVLRLPVSGVTLTPSTATVRMQLNETAGFKASVFAANNTELTDRVVTWTTSNGRVVTIQATGASATLKAVGGGVATVAAISEGKSASVSVFVTAPCCQIGEGAPTAAIQQAFQDAVTRNRLQIKLPAASPVRRIASGYLQDLEAESPAGVRYLIAMSDRSSSAALVAGAILERYLASGGPAGVLGLPLTDATARGRQAFENGVLAGSPVVLVSAAIASRWAAMGYESGAAGLPSSEAAPFLSSGATAGSWQIFTGGLFFAPSTGAQAGRAYFVGGLILARYATSGGISGPLGMPLSDEAANGGRRRQDFEGGSIDYAPGDTEARISERERRPTVAASPSSVLAGMRVRVAVSGFAANSTLRISTTGQPDFQIAAGNGAYQWELIVPPDAAGTVRIRAVDIRDPSAAAEGSYTIRSAAELAPRLSIVRGDGQAGPPGALLPGPLRIALRDEDGAPMAGVAVVFEASPGAHVDRTNATTDERGEAEARLRLPLSAGVAAATANAAGRFVTFGATVSAVSLPNFPTFSQISDKGALLASVASIVRYHQNRGEMSSMSGLADIASLDAFLKSYCGFDTRGGQICDGFVSPPGSSERIVNLWRLATFVGGNLDIVSEKTDAATIRDLIAQGSPVLIALSVAAGESHFVVATGISADASIRLHDPNPAFGRTALHEYLNGFTSGSRTIQGTVTSAVRLLPRAPAPGGFWVLSNAPVPVISPAGDCAVRIDFAAGGPITMTYCDGLQAAYGIEVPASGRFLLTNLSNPGNRVEVISESASTYKIARQASQWTPGAQDVSFTSVLNAASLRPEIAPGSLVAILGSGLTRSGGTAEVEIGGLVARVLSASPFQVNAAIPADLSPGRHLLKVVSPLGVSEQSVELRTVSPAIFKVSDMLWAIANQSGSLNSPGQPARRGQTAVAYGTGFGGVVERGNLSVTAHPVTALLNGAEAPVTFAGLTPGFVGLYQINVQIPASAAPGLNVALQFRQAEVASEPVRIAIQ